MEFTIKAIEDPRDSTDVFELILDLARFERMEDCVLITAKDFELFRAEKVYFGYLAYTASEKTPVACTVGYYHFSCVSGAMGQLEDLNVLEAFHKRGLGKRLFQNYCQHIATAGCKTLTFDVLDWNPAKTFYLKLGAVERKQVVHYRFYKSEFENLVKQYRHDGQCSVMTEEHCTNVIDWLTRRDKSQVGISSDEIARAFEQKLGRAVFQMGSDGEIAAVLLFSVSFSTFAGPTLRLTQFLSSSCHRGDSVESAQQLVHFLCEKVAIPGNYARIHCVEEQSSHLVAAMQRMGAVNLNTEDEWRAWMLKL